MNTATSTTTDRSENAPLTLLHVPFNGEHVDAARENGTVWVPVKRICQSLGIQAHGQAERLKSKPWANTQMICAVAEDGKKRMVFCLDLDSLPMWLATIDTQRVRPAVREKLVTYQKECAQVLRDHFFGERPVKDDLTRERLDAAYDLAEVMVHAQCLGVSKDDLVRKAKSVGYRVRLAMGLNPHGKLDTPEAQALHSIAGNLSCVAASLSAIETNPNCGTTLADVRSTLRSLERKARGMANVGDVLRDADVMAKPKFKEREQIVDQLASGQ